MSLDELDGTWTWVWKEPPEPIRFCQGLIVRAANGNGVVTPEGFNFQANYLHWRANFSGPMIAWTYLYDTSDPETAAAMLAAVPAVAYIIDWEDAAGPTPSGAKFQRCVDELRRLRPSVPVGFSSYPTRAQAMAHGVDWDAGIVVCDFVAPQAYFGYQLANYDQILADAKGRYVQLDVEPAAASGWNGFAQQHLATGQGVSFWRLGMFDTKVRQEIQLLQEGAEVTQSEVEAAVRRVLGISDHLAVPQGQTSNDKLAQILVGAEQGSHNEHGSLAGAIKGNTAAILELSAKVDALAAKVGPVPAGGMVAGTFTATLEDGAGQ